MERREWHKAPLRPYTLRGALRGNVFSITTGIRKIDDELYSRKLRRPQGGVLRKEVAYRAQEGGRGAFDLQEMVDGQRAAKKGLAVFWENCVGGIR